MWSYEDRMDICEHEEFSGNLRDLSDEIEIR